VSVALSRAAIRVASPRPWGNEVGQDSIGNPSPKWVRFQPVLPSTPISCARPLDRRFAMALLHLNDALGNVHCKGRLQQKIFQRSENLVIQRILPAHAGFRLTNPFRKNGR